MNNRDTGNFIAEMRKEKRLTQKDLAEKLNITDKAVSKWETGKSAPDISNLVPLSEVLGVSVIEILQGKKIAEKHFQSESEEAILNQIKKDKKKIKGSVILTAVIIFSAIFLLIFAYFSFHFFASVSQKNEEKIIEKSAQYMSDFFEENDEIKILKSDKKGNCFFYLLQSKNGVAMVMFESDKIFSDRIVPTGGSSICEPNKIGQYCFGENNITVNVFFGFDMTDSQYSYIYRGVKSIKAIEGKNLLDVIIDIDDSFTNADIVE